MRKEVFMMKMDENYTRMLPVYKARYLTLLAIAGMPNPPQWVMATVSSALIALCCAAFGESESVREFSMCECDALTRRLREWAAACETMTKSARLENDANAMVFDLIFCGFDNLRKVKRGGGGAQ